MSFGESVFSAGFNQKTRKEDQNIKRIKLNRLSASGMFLHHLPRPHLYRSLSWFDPRARVAPLGL
jgi:hypothetical protein